MTGEGTTRIEASMGPLIALAVFAVVVAVVAAVGIRLGMLLAPRIDRMTDRTEEEPGGDDD
jgi:NADH:ubiquinone oxidoreductase subunit 3 (subunit A)